MTSLLPTYLLIDHSAVGTQPAIDSLAFFSPPIHRAAGKCVTEDVANARHSESVSADVAIVVRIGGAPSPTRQVCLLLDSLGRFKRIDELATEMFPNGVLRVHTFGATLVGGVAMLGAHAIEQVDNARERPRTSRTACSAPMSFTELMDSRVGS